MKLCRKQNQSGQAAVETALILPLLLLLVLGIIEFGQAWHLRQVVTGAAREGTRVAVVQNPIMDRDSVRAVIYRALGRAGVSSGNMDVSFDTLPPPGGHWRETGAMQTVSVQCQFRFGFFGPIFQAVAGTDQITLRSEVSMRNE